MSRPLRSSERLPGPGRRRIEQHNDQDLEQAIDSAIAHCARAGLDFYRVLHGIDAYMERRRRRDKRALEKEHVFNESDDSLSDPWGNS